MSKRRIDWWEVKVSSKRIAKWGCAILILSTICAILFPVFVSARAAAKITKHLAGIKSVGIAILTFANDHDDRLPKKGQWVTSIQPYMEDKAILGGCGNLPSPEGTPCRFLFSQRFSNQKVSNLDSGAILVREAPSQSDWIYLYSCEVSGDVKRLVK